MEKIANTHKSGHGVSLPLSKVKTIMKSSPEVEHIGIDALYLMAKSAELFVTYLTTQAYYKGNGGSMIDYESLANVINNDDDEVFGFLQEIVPHKITVQEYYDIIRADKDEKSKPNVEELSDFILPCPFLNLITMFPSAFGNDPYLMDPFEHMNRMMRSFEYPFIQSPFAIGHPGMPQLGHNVGALMPHHPRIRNDLSPFGIMNDMSGMMRNMQRNMMTVEPGCHSFQSSTVVMSGGEDTPRVIQSSSSVRMGPNGVKETRKSHKDSGTGEMKMAIGHHIHDRAHVMEKMKNRRTGEEEEKQDFINIDEEEVDGFNNEWMNRMGAGSHSRHRSIAHYIGDRHEPYNRSAAHHRSRGHRSQPAAITYRPHDDVSSSSQNSRSQTRPGSSKTN